MGNKGVAKCSPFGYYADTMKRLIKKFLPKQFILTYHYLLANLANVFYGKPSEKLIVIGVTGTSGKSTVIELISAILEKSGKKVGAATTIKFKIGGKEVSNDKKMTMVGRFQLQKMLSRMVKDKCDYAIVETTSEGIEQFRHIGIHYDVCVFTNLYPEHIDSHGSFENYKRAKLKLFKKFQYSKAKVLYGKKIPRTIVANLDDEFAPEFLGFSVDKKLGFTLGKNYDITGVEEVLASDISHGIRHAFTVDQNEIEIKLLGSHNIYNALCAYSVGRALGITPSVIKAALKSVEKIPGRIEFVSREPNVIVDYAFEPKAMKKLYLVVQDIKKGRIIHVLGTTGGGRDKERGKLLGQYVGKNADIVFATNEDPYDDDPKELMMRVFNGCLESGKKEGLNLFAILDRQEAIKKALNTARNNDIVLITGKGSESKIVVQNNRMIDFSDADVVKKELG